MKSIVVSMVLACASTAFAADLTAQQIVDKAVERNAFGFENALARITLVLKNKSGNERTRQIEIRSLEAQGLGKTLVRFHAPADVAGTGFLVLEKKEGDDEQYLYLPALGKVKRITGSQKNQKFMGTDLTYSDLEFNDLRRADVKRLADDAVGGVPAYVIEASPKGSDSVYGKTVTWIHKDAFVPLKIEFFDKQQAPAKTLLVKRLEKKDGKWVAMETSIKDVKEGSSTEMKIDALDGKVKLTDADFTEQALSGG